MSTGFPHAQEIVKNSNAEVRVRPGPLHPPPCSRRPRVPHLGGSGRRGPEKGLPGTRFPALNGNLKRLKYLLFQVKRHAGIRMEYLSVEDNQPHLTHKNAIALKIKSIGKKPFDSPHSFFI